MKAFVKKGNLPYAPAPTKPVTGLDYFEKKRLQSLANAPHLHDGFKPKVVNTMTEKEKEEMCEHWKDGKSPKQIAELMGKDKKYTYNKLWYLTETGVLQKKRTNLSQEEIKEIGEEFGRGMTVPEICRKHTVGEKFVSKVTAK